MKNGLKNLLYNHIKSQGELTYKELEQICYNELYRISNGERRLRELANSGLIRTVRKSGYTASWVLNSHILPLDPERATQRANLNAQGQIQATLLDTPRDNTDKFLKALE